MKKLLAVLVLAFSFMASQAAFAQQDTTSMKHKSHSTMKKGEHKAKKAEKKAERKAKKMKHSAKKDSTMENTK